MFALEQTGEGAVELVNEAEGGSGRGGKERNVLGEGARNVQKVGNLEIGCIWPLVHSADGDGVIGQKEKGG